MKRSGLLFIAVMMLLVFGCNQNRNSGNNPGEGPGGMRPGNFNPEEMAKRQTEELKEVLGLNKEQEKQLYELTLENGKKMQKMREEIQSSDGGFEGMREQMKLMREEQNNKIKEVLSEEQFEKYQAWQEERRARRGQGGPGNGN